MTVKCLLAMLILFGTDYRDAGAAGIPPSLTSKLESGGGSR